MHGRRSGSSAISHVLSIVDSCTKLGHEAGARGVAVVRETKVGSSLCGCKVGLNSSQAAEVKTSIRDCELDRTKQLS